MVPPAGAEIDLLLAFGVDDYWGIEIKASRTPILKKGFMWCVRI